MRHSQLRFYLPTSDIRFSASAVAPAGVSDCQSECYMYVALSSRVSKESRLTDDPATLSRLIKWTFSVQVDHLGRAIAVQRPRERRSLAPLRRCARLASEGALDHGDSVGGDSGALGVKEGLAAVAL